MIKELIDKVIELIRQDCENITRLYGERSCDYCKHSKLCSEIYKLKIKK